jgi:lysophospholipase L1-like esterase
VVRLVNGGKTYGQTQAAVSMGRGQVECRVRVPANAPAGASYQWALSMLPHGAAKTKAPLAKTTVAGAFVDEKMIGAGTIAADNPDILYAGRWNRDDPKNPVAYWAGSALYTRFQGTSAKAEIAAGGDVEFLAVVDGDEEHLIKFHVAHGEGVIATGLPNTDHTLMVMKNAEAGSPATFQGLVLDAGQGLLRPEPLPRRRIEFYGDSITSGGAPDPVKPNPSLEGDGDWAGDVFRTMNALSARELGADYRMISKGGTGVSGSFVFHYTLLDFWDKLDFNGWEPDKARRWDFAQWQPEAVVVAVGHNDQFRMPSPAAFAQSYQTLVEKLHAAYPRAQIFCTNTSMSGGPLWKSAVEPLLADHPYVHFQMFDPGQGHGGHPHAQDHKDMAFGNVEWNSLADWIGGVMDW